LKIDSSNQFVKGFKKDDLVKLGFENFRSFKNNSPSGRKSVLPSERFLERKMKKRWLSTKILDSCPQRNRF
jgi:hypothetical protein